jgi:hypothetical protein
MLGALCRFSIAVTVQCSCIARSCSDLWDACHVPNKLRLTAHLSPRVSATGSDAEYCNVHVAPCLKTPKWAVS